VSPKAEPLYVRALDTLEISAGDWRPLDKNTIRAQ